MANFNRVGDHNVAPLKHELDQKRGGAAISPSSLKLPPPPPPSPQFLALKQLNTQLSELQPGSADFEKKCEAIQSELLSLEAHQHILPDQLVRLQQVLDIRHAEHAMVVSKMMCQMTKNIEDKKAEFQALNKRNVVPGWVSKMRSTITKLGGFRDDFTWQKHLHAEHMTGKHEGLDPDYPKEVTLKLLEKMSPSPERDSIIKALTYAKKAKTKSPDTIKADIKALKRGESLALSSGSSHHEMILSITCTGIDPETGKKTFKVVQHNTGRGIKSHHYRRIDERGKQRYQTALEIENVSEENLCEKKSSFINRLCGSIKTPEKLYSNILPLLKGKIAPPSKDPRLWSHGQLGGSCTSSCLRSLIRANLPIEAYKEFRDIGRMEMLLKSYRQIKSGWGNSAAQRTAALEVVKALEHSWKKRKTSLPAEMQEMKQQLEKMHGVSSSRKLKEPPQPSGSIASRLASAFTILSHGKFMGGSIKAVFPFIHSAIDRKQQGKINEKEYKELQHWMLNLRNYCEGKTLTKEETYMITALVSIAFSLAYGEGSPLSRSNKIDPFIFEMHMRYNALCLDSTFTSPYEGYINHFQKHFFETGITEPEGLQKMKEAAAAAA